MGINRPLSTHVCTFQQRQRGLQSQWHLRLQHRSTPKVALSFCALTVPQIWGSCGEHAYRALIERALYLHNLTNRSCLCHPTTCWTCDIVDQATQLRLPSIQPPVPGRVLKSYITSQYRTYELMHHYLHHPRHFSGQFMFPLSQSAKQHLIER